MVDKQQMQQWFDKAKNGFMMGGMVGMTVGFLYGSYTVLSVGPPPGKSYVATIGKYMLQSGTMLGFFLSIGSLMRSEERMPPQIPRYAPITIQHVSMRQLLKEHRFTVASPMQ